MCVCVCVCVCVFVCVCVCIGVHRCAYVPMFMSMCIEHILVYACAGVCICVYMYVFRQVHYCGCAYVCVCVCVCVCTQGWLENTLRVIIKCVPLTIRFEKKKKKNSLSKFCCFIFCFLLFITKHHFKIY